MTPPPRRALVTGAGVRVGRAIALELGAAGMNVALHYHGSHEAAEATRRELLARGGAASLHQADLREPHAARELMERVVSQLGGLDVLVLSAASFERIAYEELDDDAFARSLQLNLAAPFALAHAATPALRASKGNIVMITCSSASVPFKNHLPYVVSKGALAHLMRTLALELAPLVRVNAVAPGTVLPPEGYPEGAAERLRASIPLGRFGSAEDVARAVRFLADSPFVTGQELVIDGGRSVIKSERF